MLRVMRDWTQDDLAQRLAAAGYAMHQTTVAKLELGTRPTSIGEILEIAAIFGVTPSELLAPSAEDQLRQRSRELRARLNDIDVERDGLRSRLEKLSHERKEVTAEYRRLSRKLGEENS